MPFPTHIVAAGGYVFDKNDNMLIVKTKNRGWDCTGGQIEIGENIEDGVLREIMEESGIKASVRCLAGIYSNVGQHLFYDGVTMIPTKVMLDNDDCKESIRILADVTDQCAGYIKRFAAK